MAINTLEYAKLFQTELDKQVAQQATSGWMESNAGQVKYNGGDEIKIPEIIVQGLADYDRDNGFNQGAVTYKYQTHKLTQDRGRTFQLDAMDVDETNFGASAANVMAEFQRLHVIPEIDAYRYSFIAAKATAVGNSETYKLDEATIVKKMYSHIFKLADLGVDMSQLVTTISWPAYEVLTNNTTIQKKIDVISFTQGGINLQVKALDGIPLIPVSSNRMKTAYEFLDGTTTGQEAGGFKPAAGSLPVHWEITARNAPIGISKTDVVRIFDPQTNQKANAWKLDYRKYHDMIIADNKAKTIFVAVGE
ncbi:hypothetical protein M5X00_31865 [Paenibacillus alvei]|uniref:hypothetical protein n=1 Tax=Paenibacillus alvei TaxID=44250 RepID=UPI000287FA2B|nr:hypothetical protein [Paenibacillus alvei]EJW14292.1 hypothetical protein PAV_15c00810 [Paenibacillus alvei DSM 29]MCY9539225.1 hypothetical protein [Paenibacillus alvei]MCY9706729.1 hypothetical protein [Paenibacillus alvei]MCY9737006.1 hypothetical protein [Paenibacillus alvei]MCY9758816.1 hypothetical protein [Paenibacillus alvei]